MYIVYHEHRMCITYINGYIINTKSMCCICSTYVTHTLCVMYTCIALTQRVYVMHMYRYMYIINTELHIYMYIVYH